MSAYKTSSISFNPTLIWLNNVTILVQSWSNRGQLSSTIEWQSCSNPVEVQDWCIQLRAIQVQSISTMWDLDWDSRSSENMAAKFMKRDTFIQKVIFEQIFHFWIFLQNFNCHTSQTSIPNFCIGFWNDIGNKNLRKTIFDFYQFPVKIILVGLCLKA